LSGIEWPASLDFASHAVILEALKVEGGYEIADPVMAADLNIGAVLSLDDGNVGVEKIEHKPRIQLVSKEEDTSIPYPVSSSPTQLSFDVSTDSDASVIIRDSFYPGWHAYLDNDQEIAINKYLFIFRRLFVPAGQHTITLRYIPVVLYFGIALTLVALVVGVVAHYKFLSRRLRLFLLSR